MATGSRKKSAPHIPTEAEVEKAMEWRSGVIYIRHTADGAGRIEMHQFWNRQGFLDNLTDACDKHNAIRKKGDKLIGYEICSREQYFAEHKTRKEAEHG